MKVLIVEDEPAISHLLEVYLEREGYNVTIESDGIKGLGAAQQSIFDAIILDVGLPSLDGTEICKRLRAANNWTPILFCSARDDEIDRIVGLELGADDYITKPFSPRELVARVKAIGRRAHAPAHQGSDITIGHVRINTTTRQCFLIDANHPDANHPDANHPVEPEQQVQLTATEFDLLAYLFVNPERVVRREELLEQVWGYAEPLGTRTVDVHIAQIRQKLGDLSPIRTSRGVGYSVAHGPL